MLVNPYQSKLDVLPGTRLLMENVGGILGATFKDPEKPDRVWAIERLLAPIRGRAVSGLRARVVDQKGFVSFISQRDLEVVLGFGYPGQPCLWSSGKYPSVGDVTEGWFGLCLDEEDLADDLHERELGIRATLPNGVIPTNAELVRRIHSDGVDAEERLYMRGDVDPASGMWPDPRLETVTSRWVRIERTRLDWRMCG